MLMSVNTNKIEHILHGRKMMFSKKVKHTCTLGGRRGGPPIKTVVQLEKISCYLKKHKDTIRKILIIKIIHVELLKE